MAPESSGPASADDAQIVAGLRRRDAEAMRRAHALYADRIYSFAVRLSGRRDVADELFQQAWLTLAERAARLRPDTALLPWLLTVARNHYRSQHRRLATRQRHDETVAATIAAAPSPEVSAERRAMLARLEEALMNLPEHHREVLVLMIEADAASQQQLARVLGLSHAAFRKRLSRARAALSSLLHSEEAT